MVRRAVPAVLLVVATLLVGAGVSGLRDVDAQLAKARQQQVERKLADKCERREREQRAAQDS